MTDRPKVIAIVAGEHSGDNYGAVIMSNLKALYPDCSFIGIGGQSMLAQGLQPIMPMEMLSVVGVFNIIKRLPSLLSARNNLIEAIINAKADLFIGVDAPEFNLSVAKGLTKRRAKSKLNFKIAQYISPTVWVWRPNRIYTIDKYTDMVLCIFPFEEEIYKSKNINAKFVGHPLANKIHAKTEQDKLFARSKLIDFYKNVSVRSPQVSELSVNSQQAFSFSGRKVIGIFPGSRCSELGSLSRPFIDTIALLYRQNKHFVFVVSLVNQKLSDIWQHHYDEYLAETGQELPLIKIQLDKNKPASDLSSIDIMQSSDIILCASGTTTLEALLVNTPMVVAYKVSMLNALLIKLLIKVKYVAMSNILSDRLFGTKLVPEILQEQVTAENLGQAILSELDKYDANNIDASQFINKWHEIQKYLKSANINHEQAVVNTLQELIANEQ